MKENLTTYLIELGVASVICIVLLMVVVVPIFAGLW